MFLREARKNTQNTGEKPRSLTFSLTIVWVILRAKRAKSPKKQWKTTWMRLEAVHKVRGGAYHNNLREVKIGGAPQNNLHTSFRPAGLEQATIRLGSGRFLSSLGLG